MKRIEVTILPSGETHIETHGFQGESCRDATKQLEASLGVLGNESVKPEFYQTEPTNNYQREVQ